jgi:hypothetical protein
VNNSQVLNLKNYNAVAWGLLSILWGITVLFDFVPLGIGLVGTGLILLGANIFLLLNGLPTKSDNTLFGLLALAWGGLELARPLLRILFQSADLDWVIFAILLMGLGLILLIRGLVRSWRIDLQKE